MIGAMRREHLLYGTEGMELMVPEEAEVLVGQQVPAVDDPRAAVCQALDAPIGAPPLARLLAERRPSSVAITISDITRPVPNRLFLPALLRVLNEQGISDDQVVVIIGTGMHRPSTVEEREIMLGRELCARLEVVDHLADRPETLARVSEDPPVQINDRFARADFRIVTGYIEPHFMAGFSGGRKGVFPALVDLRSLERFHGYDTLSHPRADNGILEGNPCHEIALQMACLVGVDFLLNVALTRDRRIAGVYCGDLEQAHLAGCQDVARWTTAPIDGPFDLVITNGGGFPLDQTFYQTIKGMVSAMPALKRESTMLIVSDCGQQLGSQAYSDLLLKWDNDWQGFMRHISEHGDRTELDQWEVQMQCRVLDRIGIERLWLVSDGIPEDVQRRISVSPVLGTGDARQRAQQAIHRYLAAHPRARVAVIPDGPYTMLSCDAPST